MNHRNLMVLGAALVVAAFVVFLLNSYLSGYEERAETQARAQQLQRIVVASQPLEFGQALTSENLRLANFPASSVPQGAFHSLADVLRGGRVALRPIVAGEPVLADKVSGADGRAVLAANLADGMRAVAIPVNEVSSVAGFARPGDTVDVLLTRQIPGDGAGGQDQMTDVILERVKLLAIDQVANEQDTQPKVGSTAVVEVDIYSAQKLVLAQKLGTLSLALRNVENQTPAVAGTVTARDLGAGGMVRPIRARAAAVAAAAPTPQIFAQPAAARPAAVAPARPMGPTMSIVRGVEQTEEPVGRLGGSR